MYSFPRPVNKRPPDPDDGTVILEYTPLWAIRKHSNSSRPVLRLVHEVTHFTHPIPDGEDPWGRHRYVTLHRIVTLETETSLPQDVVECPQFSLRRDSPPPEDLWPRKILQYRRRVIRRAGVQVFTRYFLCDDEEYDLDMRRELPSRRAS